MKRLALLRTVVFAAVVALAFSASASAQATYALGNWTVTAKQDKGVKRLFNRMNRDIALAAISDGSIVNAGGSGYTVGNVLTLVDSGTTTVAMTFTVSAVGANGAVTGVTLTDPGSYTTHQGQANHQTTVAPSGGTGCVLRINFYNDIPMMITRNGGILDGAATSYSAQYTQELQAAIGAAIEGASDATLAAVATALGVSLPK